MGRDPSRVMSRASARTLRAAARVVLGAAVALLVGVPPSGWADTGRVDRAGNLPTLSTAGVDAVALARPPTGSGPVSVDVPGFALARPALRGELAHGDGSAACSREHLGRAHARGPPAG